MNSVGMWGSEQVDGSQLVVDVAGRAGHRGKVVGLRRVADVVVVGGEATAVRELVEVGGLCGEPRCRAGRSPCRTTGSPARSRSRAGRRPGRPSCGRRSGVVPPTVGDVGPTNAWRTVAFCIATGAYGRVVRPGARPRRRGGVDVAHAVRTLGRLHGLRLRGSQDTDRARLSLAAADEDRGGEQGEQGARSHGLSVGADSARSKAASAHPHKLLNGASCDGHALFSGSWPGRVRRPGRGSRRSARPARRRAPRRRL